MTNSQKPEGYQFKDIKLIHNYGSCDSRSNLDITVEDSTGKIHNSPIILSNMPCCQTNKVLKIFNSMKWPYIFHRIQSSQILFLNKIIKENWHLKSISVGVQENDLNILETIKSTYGKDALDWITIDVAFIYNRKNLEFIKTVRKMFPDAYLIAGNFTTPCATKWLIDLGVNAGKFGISTSKLCKTGPYTGFSSCATDLLECSDVAANAKNGFDLIQDGGIGIDEETGESAYGDIFKAIVFGAKWVSSSSLFRWCSELADDDGNILQYGNSTEKAKGHSKNIEGAVKTVKTNGMSIKDQMETIKQNLQSSMSYADVENLNEVYRSVRWRVVK